METGPHVTLQPISDNRLNEMDGHHVFTCSLLLIEYTI